MTLRRRLLVAVAVLAVLALVAGTAVVLAQRAFLVGRLDAQVAALAQNPRAVLLASQRADGAVATAALSDVYVGRMTGDGRLTTVLAPQTDPDLVPALDPGERIPTPEGRATASGAAQRVRVVTVELPNGRAQAVVAVPTTPADVATRRLAATLGLAGLVAAVLVGLLLWWVDRLGLRPIAGMTEAAGAITAGDTARRVPPGPPGTEAARLGEALNTMIDTTTATQERMRRFVADASHELRTPLTTVGGYAALHAARPPGPLDDAGRAEVDDAMRRIGDEAGRMRRLVDGLLDLTGLESPDALRREPVDLAALLRDVASDLRVVAPDRVVTLEGPERLVVDADRDRVTQAVVGLTSNAVRHTPAGTPVALRLHRVPGWVRVEVSDAGPGIPAEHLPHLLERFYRVDRSRSSGSGGSGLGLAVVEAVARAHGGSVAVSSSPGVGTTFVLDLPDRPA
ncbi:HAMP domain-containing sensor histidine kinase [Arthrobacter sp. NEB 688]|uniref:sensor histidine kinase n=1 Tax=Arthrobacter sp. NEB 688 TaxID=904039 RepID=UPI001565C002|nr:HAMP domain-containing sensor histidine kinase [Arthrobacter sp. NEB 688]QKE83333.1 HAMP domain-containing histidine kinase [Arthrobacter sp. NEB 688]